MLEISSGQRLSPSPIAMKMPLPCGPQINCAFHIIFGKVPPQLPTQLHYLGGPDDHSRLAAVVHW
jgi:hypothetical protein